MKDSFKMLRQVQQLQKELESNTVEASAGGGAVTVVANGAQKLVSVRIDPDAAGDAEMLQDLILTAVNEAMEKSKQMATAKLQSGLGMPPGML